MKGVIKLENKYPSNSHKSKEKARNEASIEKKVDKPITSKASHKKKGAARKFSDIFLAEDAHNVGEFVLTDVAIPLLKDLCFNVISTAASIVFFGERGIPARRSTAEKYGYGGRGYTNYNRASERRDRQPVSRSRSSYSYDEIYLPSRGEADAVLYRMDELIDEYGQVSIGDLYDLVDITGNFTDYKYGWTDLRTADAIRTRDGYLLKLPRAIALD